MKNKFLALVLLFTLFITGCHEHEFEAATCINPKKCKTCGEIEGIALGHRWIEATCDIPKKCSVCHKTVGEPTENHRWCEATLYSPEKCSACGKTKGNKLSKEVFLEKLKTTPLYVESARKGVYDSNYKALYPDILHAYLKNNSGKTIKNATVAFLAWDKNNLPVKIYITDNNGSIGEYLVECDYDNINMIDGSTYGSDCGLELHWSYCDTISIVKAIVVDYTDFDGNKWTNPYYNDWILLYRDKILD